MAKIGDMFGSKAPINSYKLDKMTKASLSAIKSL